MDLLQRLHDGLVLQEIIPRLDPRSRVLADAEGPLPAGSSPADSGIPMRLSNQQLGYSLLQPAPPSSERPIPPRPFSRTASWMGTTVDYHVQYAPIVVPPPPTSMIGPLPLRCMFLYIPFQTGESFEFHSGRNFSPATSLRSPAPLTHQNHIRTSKRRPSSQTPWPWQQIFLKSTSVSPGNMIGPRHYLKEHYKR